MSVHLSDEEALADKPQEIFIRAMGGRCIVWFLPYRRSSGVIEIPDTAKEQSVEAIVIDDNSGYDLPRGMKVLVSRVKGNGRYFDLAGAQLCDVGRDGLILIEEEAA